MDLEGSSKVEDHLNRDYLEEIKQGLGKLNRWVADRRSEVGAQSVIGVYFFHPHPKSLPDGTKGTILLCDLVKNSKVTKKLQQLMEVTGLPAKYFRVIPLTHWVTMNSQSDPVMSRADSTHVSDAHHHFYELEKSRLERDQDVVEQLAERDRSQVFKSTVPV